MSTSIMRSAAACIGVITLASAAAPAQTPGVYLVGYAAGTTSSRVYGLSADGRIAAGASAGSSIAPGFMWSETGGRNDFGLELGLPPFTAVYGISGDGTTVVGQSALSAFRYRGPGTYQTLGLLPGTMRAWALGVSGDGSVVVGQSQPDGFLYSRAFRWTESAGMQDLGVTRPGNTYTNARAISRDGATIVGHSADSGGYVDAFVWTQAGGMQILPQLPGTPVPASRAVAVNFDGSIIVGESGPLNNAVMWRDGTVIDLGTAPGWAHGSDPRAVSDDGGVVGCQLFSGPLQAAGVWTPARGMEPLADYLTSFGVTVPNGWTLQDCSSVSADGLVFGGWARSATGEFQGFVAVVPAPGAVDLVLVGVFAGGRRRRPSPRDDRDGPARQCCVP